MRLRHCGIAIAIATSGVSAAAQAQEQVATDGPSRGRFWHSAAGVATVNWLTWAYNWYVQRWQWSNVSLHSWGQNIRHGFVWDNDCFLDNQLAHPYHGSFYHSSARASGYGFWAAIPFVAAGSATWELFGENITPSLNDLVNTTLGGLALGEVTYRLSSLLSEGRGRLSRELGAFALSPVGKAQGLLSGREERFGAGGIGPPGEAAVLAVGRRSEHTFVELTIRYGDPFASRRIRPYDAFDFRLQVSPDATGIVHHLNVSGLLARRSLSQSRKAQLALGLFQHYDYDDLAGLQSGGNSLSAALLYRRRLGSRDQLNLVTHAEGILLGGISADQGFYWRRDYDLGPGVGTRVAASWVRDGREWLRFDGRLWWLQSLHGSNGNHLATSLRVAAALPLVSGIGVGGDVMVTTRRSVYPDAPPINRRVPHLRAYLTWAPN